MNVGIMTFHASNNCGSMLQAYALQKTLIHLNVNNEIIDYSNKKQRHLYSFIRFPINHHDILHNFGVLLFFPVFFKHYNDYKHFKNNYLDLSKENYKTLKDLLRISNDYEIYIAGSDQVWNIMCPDADDAYFLNFTNKKKVAYSPSFGNTVIERFSQDVDKYRRLLNDFSYISIRECNGAKWIKHLIGRTVPVLLDPSLLLSYEEYTGLIKELDVISEKYIFYYAFSYSDEVNEYVKKISNKLKLPVYVIDARGWLKKAWKYGFKLYKHSGPLYFINLLFNAELVLTTSFHGTAFSVIGHKNFWFIDSKMRDPDDDRAYTLIRGLNLEDRMILGEKLMKINIMEKVNYSIADELLNKQKVKSLNFLKQALDI